ncbi:MAG: hypothetical protein AABX33_02680 [Nanoarchaeota archaeon]
MEEKGWKYNPETDKFQYTIRDNEGISKVVNDLNPSLNKSQLGPIAHEVAMTDTTYINNVGDGSRESLRNPNFYRVRPGAVISASPQLLSSLVPA